MVSTIAEQGFQPHLTGRAGKNILQLLHNLAMLEMKSGWVKLIVTRSKPVALLGQKTYDIG